MSQRGKLSDDEQEPREVLTVDFLKRCWGVVLQREDESGPTAVVVLADTRVGSGVAPEAPILGAMVLEGVPLGSAAKPTLPGGASTSAVISAAEADAEYERVAAQVAAQRAKEMTAVDDEISKRESDIEVASVRRLFERSEHERVATANFSNEMKRRQERLEDLDREKSSPSGYKIQSASEYERMRRSEAQSAPGGASKPSRDNPSQGGGEIARRGTIVI